MKKVLQRFVDVWKLDFLAKFFAGEKKDNKTTVLFWIISNMLITVLVSISLCVFLCTYSDDLIVAIDENVPDHARIAIVDGQFTTENINEPFFREISAHNTNNKYNGSFVIIIDSTTDTYDITSLDEYDGGMIVLRDRAYFKDGAQFNHVVFSEAPDFTISKDEVISFVDKHLIFPFFATLTVFVGIFIFLWFSVFRLVGAFWWALMLFILMRIFEVREGYMTAYKAVLNLYFIPTVAVFGLGLLHVHVPFLTTWTFIAVFIANLIWLKRQRKKNLAEQSVKNVENNAKDRMTTQIKK